MTILTVDDESSIRRMIRTFLEREGLTVREAASGQEALALIQEEPEIRLVLSDMSMPGMSGNELAKQLLSLRPGIPIVFVSAFNDEVDECYRDFARLNKPFSGKELLTRVRSQLKLSACA